MGARIPVPPSRCRNSRSRMRWFSHILIWSGGERKTVRFSIALCTWTMHLLCLAGLHQVGWSSLFHGLLSGRLKQGLTLVRTTIRLRGLPLAGAFRERMQRALRALGLHVFPLTFQANTSDSMGRHVTRESFSEGLGAKGQWRSDGHVREVNTGVDSRLLPRGST